MLNYISERGIGDISSLIFSIFNRNSIYLHKGKINIKKTRKMSKKFTDQLPKIGIVVSVLLLIVGLWLDRMKLVSAGAIFMLCNLGVIFGGYLAKQKNN